MSLLKKSSLALLIIGVLFVSSPALAAIQGAADYRSSLVSGITSSATSLSVVSTSTPSGEALLSGSIYGLKLGGREYVLGLLGGNKQFTSLIRGVSLINGTTTGGVPEAWGRGTSVEITDAPVLLEILNKIAGRQFIDNPLRYATTVSTTSLATNGNYLASVAYVNGISFGAVPQASETTAGYSQLATQFDAASSTSIGSTGARLVLGSNLATSTYNAATSPYRVVMTGATGKIDTNFLGTLATSTTIGSTYAFDIGKHMRLFNTVGTTTWAVPNGIKTVFARIVGGGGGGTGGCAGTCVGSGSGAGGYAESMIDVSATSSLSIGVGDGGAPSAFSSASQAGTGSTTAIYLTAGSPIMSATGGTGAALSGSTGAVAGGVGGVGIGTATSTGQSGGYSVVVTTGPLYAPGIGGSSVLGKTCGGGVDGSVVGAKGSPGCVILYW